jgi:hypothetical protein
MWARGGDVVHVPGGGGSGRGNGSGGGGGGDSVIMTIIVGIVLALAIIWLIAWMFSSWENLVIVGVLAMLARKLMA